MYPILFFIGDFPFPSYGVAYLAAFLAAASVVAHLLAERFGQPFGRMFGIAFQTAIAGEVGARLTFVIVEWERFFAGAISFKQFLFAGRVVLGGVVAGLGFAAWLFRRFGFPALPVLDCIVVGLSLGMAIGRIGCLLSGCCYGAPTDLAWGITFTDPAAQQYNGTPLHQPLHPTQPLQMTLAFAIFGLLWLVYRRKRFDGQVLATFLVLAGALRFFTEFLRGDRRGAALGLATSQWIGIGMAVLAAMWLAWRLLRPRPPAPADPGPGASG